eukprot:918785_1
MTTHSTTENSCGSSNTQDHPTHMITPPSKLQAIAATPTQNTRSNTNIEHVIQPNDNRNRKPSRLHPPKTQDQTQTLNTRSNTITTAMKVKVKQSLQSKAIAATSNNDDNHQNKSQAIVAATNNELNQSMIAESKLLELTSELTSLYQNNNMMDANISNQTLAEFLELLMHASFARESLKKISHLVCAFIKSNNVKIGSDPILQPMIKPLNQHEHTKKISRRLRQVYFGQQQDNLLSTAIYANCIYFLWDYKRIDSGEHGDINGFGLFIGKPCWILAQRAQYRLATGAQLLQINSVDVSQMECNRIVTYLARSVSIPCTLYWVNPSKEHKPMSQGPIQSSSRAHGTQNAMNPPNPSKEHKPMSQAPTKSSSRTQESQNTTDQNVIDVIIASNNIVDALQILQAKLSGWQKHMNLVQQTLLIDPNDEDALQIRMILMARFMKLMTKQQTLSIELTAISIVKHTQ